jgi:hypothetical protein
MFSTTKSILMNKVIYHLHYIYIASSLLKKKIEYKLFEGRLRIKLYDKRDDFNIPIVNFSFICSNIPAAPAYGVYISQVIRYSRVCGSYKDVVDKGCC